MSKLPSKWAICDAAWGEGKKHLYCPDAESLLFYATEEAARNGAADAIQEGSKMVMVMEIKHVVAARPVEVEVIE